MSGEGDATRTLVIIVGASEYPDYRNLSNPAYANSAAAVAHYFLKGFRVPSKNILSLFDIKRSPTELYDDITAFLKQAMAQSEQSRPRNVIVYYIGHGFFGDDRAYFLAVAYSKEGAQEHSIRFRQLQRTVKEQTRTLRKFYLIDACFSGAALKEMSGVEPVTERIFAEAKQEALDDLPNSGTALLAAAPPDDVALTPAGERHTMFTGALLEALKGRPPLPRLTVRQLHGATRAAIIDRFGEKGVSPQLHSPEQKQGDIADVPLFPGSQILRMAYPDALDSESFKADDALYAVVVKGPAALAEAKVPLEREVARAWKQYGPQIVAAANHYREGLRLPPVPPNRKDGGLVITELRVEQAVESEKALGAAIKALCRCEVAVFDLTGIKTAGDHEASGKKEVSFDQAVVFLLGVRSVARRGVTLSSIGGSYIIGDDIPVPFNLQLVNLSVHSEEQLARGEGNRPYELIGMKLQNGFRELADLPHYEDLPTYDAVRQLGVQSHTYRPIRYTEKVLVLCPFGAEYSKNNWRLHLEVDLPVELRERARRANPPEDVKPRVERLLDVRTPRLVSETLYNAIRLTDLCIIDWTNFRPNVIFEAGVRLATNPLGAVHIIDATTLSAEWPSHVQELFRLFDPVIYQCEPGGVPYDEFMRRFEDSVRAYGQGHYGFVFREVGTSVELRSQAAAMSLVDVLLRDANLLSSDEEESTGVSPVLYHEVNKELVLAARDAAADRRFAAWLYLTHRFSAKEVAGDVGLREQFRLLKSQVRRWARSAGRADVIASIKSFDDEVASHLMSGAPK
jgi:Caspase domain